MDTAFVPPDEVAEGTDTARQPWRTEYDVVTALRALGHEVVPLGVSSDLGVIRATVAQHQPHVAFNLLEEFDGRPLWDQNIVSYLELLHLPYTGCGPRSLMLARDKALSKKIFAYHRIPVPEFAVYPRGRAVKRPRRLEFPLIVKSLTAEASRGIAQASLVDDDEKLRERVNFIHEQIGTDAIVERYIEGRELYVSILGNHRLHVFPIWELLFTKMPDDIPRIATEKVKWDFEYQQKRGIISQQARDLSPETHDQITRLGKRIYRVLGMSGYARIDLRLTDAGKAYVLEANPNPQLAYGEDFAEAAHTVGVSYNELLQRIINLGLRRGVERIG